MSKFGLLLLAAVLLTTAEAAAKGPMAPRTVFGIVWQKRQTSVAELNALTLRPVSKTAALGVAGRYLGRSPGGGGRAAFAVGESGSRIVFVDVEKMKREGALSLPCGVTGAITWETADRLVVACGGPASSVLVVDPVTRRLRSRTAIRGTLIDVQAVNGVLVGLLAPLDGIGQARLVVARGSGRVRTIALPGIRAGSVLIDQETYRIRIEHPALALEPDGHRAVVIPAVGAVVEVDLARLDTVAHALAARTLARANKEVEGASRHAVWTWSETIAMSGTDGVPGQAHTTAPAGVTLIDAEKWTSRDLGAGTNVASNGMSLLGWSLMWDAARQRTLGNGLTGYAADGAERFHLFGDEAITTVTLAGTYAYVASADARRFRIVDTESGKIIGDVRTTRPTTLAPMRSRF